MLLALEAHKCWGSSASWARTSDSGDQDQVPFYQRFRNRYKPLVEPTYTASQIPPSVVDGKDVVVEVGDEWEELEEAENLVILQEFSVEDPIREGDENEVQESTVPINDATPVQGHLAAAPPAQPGGSQNQNEPELAPISQTTSTVSPQLLSRQDFVPTIQQTKDGLDPLDRSLQLPQPVPSTLDGSDSSSQRRTTSPPQQPLNSWPRPTIALTNSHNLRRRPPIFSALHINNPQRRSPESLLVAEPVHPRGRHPWSWLRGVQNRLNAAHRSDSWTHSSQRRSPSHL